MRSFDQPTDNAVVENFQPGRDRLEFVDNPGLASFSGLQAGLNTDPAGDTVIYFSNGRHQSSVTLIGVSATSARRLWPIAVTAHLVAE